jgi:hypothetical protein
MARTAWLSKQMDPLPFDLELAMNMGRCVVHGSARSVLARIEIQEAYRDFDSDTHRPDGCPNGVANA